MAEEAAPTITETSATVETGATETTATNDAATSALGDAAASEAGAENAGGETAAVAAEATEATTEETAAAAVPEAYELTAPEGFSLDAKHVEAATPVFKELGLTNDQANKLMPVAAEFAKDIASGIEARQLQEVTAWRNERLTEAKADPEVGGAKWDESIALSAKALDQFGATKGSEFRNWLTETGLGNHVEFIRMFSKIGREVGEGGFTRADAGAKTDAPIWDRIYSNSEERKG